MWIAAAESEPESGSVATFCRVRFVTRLNAWLSGCCEIRCSQIALAHKGKTMRCDRVGQVGYSPGLR